MKKLFQLGIVFKEDKPISHRSLLKIFLNPLLRRIFGIAIASVIKDNQFIQYKIIKQREPKEFNFNINFDYDYIK